MDGQTSTTRQRRGPPVITGVFRTEDEYEQMAAMLSAFHGHLSPFSVQWMVMEVERGTSAALWLTARQNGRNLEDIAMYATIVDDDEDQIELPREAVVGKSVDEIINWVRNETGIRHEYFFEKAKITRAQTLH